jgi:hypothetical protein
VYSRGKGLLLQIEGEIVMAYTVRFIKKQGFEAIANDRHPVGEIEVRDDKGRLLIRTAATFSKFRRIQGLLQNARSNGDIVAALGRQTGR